MKRISTIAVMEIPGSAARLDDGTKDFKSKMQMASLLSIFSQHKFGF